VPTITHPCSDIGTYIEQPHSILADAPLSLSSQPMISHTFNAARTMYIGQRWKHILICSCHIDSTHSHGFYGSSSHDSVYRFASLRSASAHSGQALHENVLLATKMIMRAWSRWFHLEMDDLYSQVVSERGSTKARLGSRYAPD
jgi:hypothetical protein